MRKTMLILAAVAAFGLATVPAMAADRNQASAPPAKAKGPDVRMSGKAKGPDVRGPDVRMSGKTKGPDIKGPDIKGAGKPAAH